MMEAYFTAEFACSSEIADPNSHPLALLNDSIAHLHFSQIYKVLGENIKSKDEFNDFLDLFAKACSCDDECLKKD